MPTPGFRIFIITVLKDNDKFNFGTLEKQINVINKQFIYIKHLKLNHLYEVHSGLFPIFEGEVEGPFQFDHTAGVGVQIRMIVLNVKVLHQLEVKIRNLYQSTDENIKSNID